MSEIEWGRLRAPELRALAAQNAVVILPVGSIEQHGPHLPTQVDALLAGEIARRAARKAAPATPIVVAPTVWSGLAEHHMSLGATLSLDFEAFFALLRGLVRSLVRHGFGRVLLLNGHGGNIAALTVIANELGVELEAPIATTTYWLLARDAYKAVLQRQSTVRHACEAETSMLLVLAPELVDMTTAQDAVGPTARELADVVGSDAVHRWRSFASRTSHGAIGDPRAATPEKGERLLDATAEAVARLVTNQEFWELR